MKRDLVKLIAKKCALYFAVAFTLTNFTYFLPDFYTPSRSSGEKSSLSELRDVLNYSSDSRIINNLRKNRDRTGYVILGLLAPIGIGLLGGIGTYFQEKNKRSWEK